MYRDLNTLIDYVQRATVVYRKGDVVKTSTSGALAVLTIDNFPALPNGDTTVVDCHFVDVGFTEALAEQSHDDFRALVRLCREGVFATMDDERWAAGPSYIEVGGWIGDQTLAFQFMAVCVAHGLADAVITPARLHITDEARAAQMAGLGYVMLAPMALAGVQEVTG